MTICGPKNAHKFKDGVCKQYYETFIPIPIVISRKIDSIEIPDPIPIPKPPQDEVPIPIVIPKPPPPPT